MACSRIRKTDLHVKWSESECRWVNRWPEGGSAVQGSLDHEKKFGFILSIIKLAKRSKTVE